MKFGSRVRSLLCWQQRPGKFRRERLGGRDVGKAPSDVIVLIVATARKVTDL
jgi:hypothetical protein